MIGAGLVAVVACVLSYRAGKDAGREEGRKEAEAEAKARAWRALRRVTSGEDAPGDAQLDPRALSSGAWLALRSFVLSAGR